MAGSKREAKKGVLFTWAHRELPVIGSFFWSSPGESLRALLEQGQKQSIPLAEGASSGSIALKGLLTGSAVALANLLRTFPT
jgi:hypothetical protein